MRWTLIAAILTVGAVTGCEMSDPYSNTAEQPATQARSAPATAEAKSAVDTGNAAAPATSAAESETSQSKQQQPPGEQVTRRKAEFGVGKKGHDLGDGILLTPVRIYFTVGERVVFDIQIPQAMNLYKGEHGYFPKSHEEFMEKIIKFNNIELPELPEGSRFVYDPKSEQLMVEQRE